MPAEAEAPVKKQYEILDHNVAAGYVTLIVDVWDGELNDPATSIRRYIGVWRVDDLWQVQNTETDEGEYADPDFSGARTHRSYSSGHGIKPEPMVWERLENVREGDKEAKRAKEEDEAIFSEHQYKGFKQKQQQERFEKFIEAIEALSENRDNEEAWAVVDAYRKHNHLIHEK